MITKQNVTAAVEVLITMARQIVEAKRVPAGTLYAAFMAVGLSLNDFNDALGVLVKQGICERQGDLLISLLS